MKKLLTTLVLGLAAVSGAQAQAWPSKPVTLVVPYSAGGPTDVMARSSLRMLMAAGLQPRRINHFLRIRGGPSATRRLRVSGPAGLQPSASRVTMQLDAKETS